MEQTKFGKDTNKLLQFLEDTGLEPKLRKPLLTSFQRGQWELGKNILLNHRAQLLSELHKGQDKLYNIDFLLQKIKQLK